VTKIDTGSKFKMAATAILNSVYNSVAIPCICMKVDMWTKFYVLHAAIFNKHQIQDGGSRHFCFFYTKRNKSAAD